MATGTADDLGVAPGAPVEAAPRKPGIFRDAKALRDELIGLAHDQLSLAALETRLAGKSLVTMVIAGVVLAVLLLSAWLGLVATAVLLLVSAGMAASVAMLLAVAVNLIAAAVAYEVIRRQSRNLRFAATLDSVGRLAGESSRRPMEAS